MELFLCKISIRESGITNANPVKRHDRTVVQTVASQEQESILHADRTKEQNSLSKDWDVRCRKPNHQLLKAP